MSAGLGVQGYGTIISAVQSGESTLKDNIICFGDSIPIPSTPAMIQLYSDKLNKTFKSSTFQFYPVHFLLLNLTEEVPKRLIMCDKTVLGYLPTLFLCSSEHSNL